MTPLPVPKQKKKSSRDESTVRSKSITNADAEGGSRIKESRSVVPVNAASDKERGRKGRAVREKGREQGGGAYWAGRGTGGRRPDDQTAVIIIPEGVK